MKYFPLFILIYWSYIGLSQEFSRDHWHQGKVVMMNSYDTVSGSIKYNLKLNNVFVKNQHGTKPYSCKKVIYFEFEDALSQRPRRFYSLPYYVQPDYKSLIFFEVILEGNMTLLAREYVAMTRVGTSYDLTLGSSYTQLVLKHNVYFLDNVGNITMYHFKKQGLFQIFRKKEKQIRQYIKKNRVRYSDLNDLIKITQYYNELFQPNLSDSK